MPDSLMSALHSIPADDRDTWVSVGMALHAELGDAGFLAWNTWSQQSPAYRASDAKSVWRGFKRGGGVTIATLYLLAREHGWQGQDPVMPQENTGARLRREAETLKERERSRRREHRAAPTAAEMLGEAELLPHEYLARKGFPGVEGLVMTRNNLLLVPMRSVRTGLVNSLQTITAAGDKRFLAGGKAKGAVYNLGRAWTRWYCEGYATGLSVQAALRLMHRDDQVVVCFSAANLAQVGTPGWSEPRPRYVIADHDWWRCPLRECDFRWAYAAHSCPNCGYGRVIGPAGEKYARKTGLPYWIPPEAGMDANDFHQAHGLDGLADALREAIHDLADRGPIGPHRGLSRFRPGGRETRQPTAGVLDAHRSQDGVPADVTVRRGGIAL